MRPPEGWRLGAGLYSPESNGNQSHRLGHAASVMRDARVNALSTRRCLTRRCSRRAAPGAHQNRSAVRPRLAAERQRSAATGTDNVGVAWTGTT
jgi:hypothetical protein